LRHADSARAARGLRYSCARVARDLCLDCAWTSFDLRVGWPACLGQRQSAVCTMCTEDIETSSELVGVPPKGLTLRGNRNLRVVCAWTVCKTKFLGPTTPARDNIIFMALAEVRREGGPLSIYSLHADSRSLMDDHLKVPPHSTVYCRRDCVLVWVAQCARA
jgi:hypothetical protein